jgi:hypothetical protein
VWRPALDRAPRLITDGKERPQIVPTLIGNGQRGLASIGAMGATATSSPMGSIQPGRAGGQLKATALNKVALTCQQAHSNCSRSLVDSIIRKWLPCEVGASQMMPAYAGFNLGMV